MRFDHRPRVLRFGLGLDLLFQMVDDRGQRTLDPARAKAVALWISSSQRSSLILGRWFHWWSHVRCPVPIADWLSGLDLVDVLMAGARVNVPSDSIFWLCS